mgnify:CR=1 FL=1
MSIFNSNKKVLKKETSIQLVKNLDINIDTTSSTDDNALIKFFGAKTSPLFMPEIINEGVEAINVHLNNQLNDDWHEGEKISVVIRINDSEQKKKFRKKKFTRQTAITNEIENQLASIAGTQTVDGEELQYTFEVKIEFDCTNKSDKNSEKKVPSFSLAFGPSFQYQNIERPLCNLFSTIEPCIVSSAELNAVYLTKIYAEQQYLALDEPSLGNKFYEAGLDKLSDQCLFRLSEDSHNTYELIISEDDISAHIQESENGNWCISLSDTRSDDKSYIIIKPIQTMCLKLNDQGKVYILKPVDKSVQNDKTHIDVDSTQQETEACNDNSFIGDELTSSNDSFLSSTQQNNELVIDNNTVMASPYIPSIQEPLQNDSPKPTSQNNNNTNFTDVFTQQIPVSCLRLNGIFIPRLDGGVYSSAGPFYFTKDGQLTDNKTREEAIELWFEKDTCRVIYLDKTYQVNTSESFNELGEQLKSLDVNTKSLQFHRIEESDPLSKLYQFSVNTYIDKHYQIAEFGDSSAQFFGRNTMLEILPNIQANLFPVESDAVAKHIGNKNNQRLVNFHFSRKQGYFQLKEDHNVRVELITQNLKNEPKKIANCHISTSTNNGEWSSIALTDNTAILAAGNMLQIGCFSWVLEVG